MKKKEKEGEEKKKEEEKGEERKEGRKSLFLKAFFKGPLTTFHVQSTI